MVKISVHLIAITMMNLTSSDLFQADWKWCKVTLLRVKPFCLHFLPLLIMRLSVFFILSYLIDSISLRLQNIYYTCGSRPAMSLDMCIE